MLDSSKIGKINPYTLWNWRRRSKASFVFPILPRKSWTDFWICLTTVWRPFQIHLAFPPFDNVVHSEKSVRPQRIYYSQPRIFTEAFVKATNWDLMKLAQAFDGEFCLSDFTAGRSNGAYPKSCLLRRRNIRNIFRVSVRASYCRQVNSAVARKTVFGCESGCWNNRDFKISQVKIFLCRRRRSGKVFSGAMSVKEVQKVSGEEYTKKTTINTDAKIVIAQNCQEV